MPPETQVLQPQVEKQRASQKSPKTVWYIGGAIIVLTLICGLYLLFQRPKAVSVTATSVIQKAASQEASSQVISTHKTHLIGLNPDMFTYFGMEKPL